MYMKTIRNIKKVCTTIGTLVLGFLVGRVIGFLTSPKNDVKELLEMTNENAIILFIASFFIMTAFVMDTVLNNK